MLSVSAAPVQQPSSPAIQTAQAVTQQAVTPGHVPVASVPATVSGIKLKNHTKHPSPQLPNATIAAPVLAQMLTQQPKGLERLVQYALIRYKPSNAGMPSPPSVYDTINHIRSDILSEDAIQDIDALRHEDLLDPLTFVLEQMLEQHRDTSDSDNKSTRTTLFDMAIDRYTQLALNAAAPELFISA